MKATSSALLLLGLAACSQAKNVLTGSWSDGVYELMATSSHATLVAGIDLPPK